MAARGCRGQLSPRPAPDDRAENWLNLSVDHVVPEYLAKLGWPTDSVLDLINLVTCCRACNEFLNGYRIVNESLPQSLAELIAVRDRAFDEKRDLAQRRHALERDRYQTARAAGPTEAQEDIEEPLYG